MLRDTDSNGIVILDSLSLVLVPSWNRTFFSHYIKALVIAQLVLRYGITVTLALT